MLIIPVVAEAASAIVQCGNSTTMCTIQDFFALLVRIYHFIWADIAAPLAVLAVIIGGVLLIVSAGNPGLFELGKKILYAAVIGLFLTGGSWLIIDFIVCKALGYCTWSASPF